MTQTVSGFTVPAGSDPVSSIDDTLVTFAGEVEAATKDVVFNTQTGTSYTLALTDRGKTVTLSNASAITLTVPPQSSVAWPNNARIDLAQLGAGQVTISPGSGVTINSYQSKTKLAGQYAAGSLIRIGSDTWLLVGALG